MRVYGPDKKPIPSCKRQGTDSAERTCSLSGTSNSAELRNQLLAPSDNCEMLICGWTTSSEFQAPFATSESTWQLVPAKDALVPLAAVIGSRQLAHHWYFEPNDLQSESSDDMYLMCSAVGVGNAGEFLLNFRR